MSGLSDESLDEEIKKVLLNKLKEMVQEDDYSLITSKETSLKYGFAESRKYKREIEGFGIIELVWMIDKSKGRKFLDDLVFPLYCIANIWLMMRWITMSFWEAVVRRRNNGKSIEEYDVELCNSAVDWEI
jgi:hypothetical protein